MGLICLAGRIPDNSDRYRLVTYLLSGNLYIKKNMMINIYNICIFFNNLKKVNWYKCNFSDWISDPSLVWTIYKKKIVKPCLKDLENWILDTAEGQNLIALDYEHNSDTNKGWTGCYIGRVSGLCPTPYTGNPAFKTFYWEKYVKCKAWRIFFKKKNWYLVQPDIRSRYLDNVFDIWPDDI